MTTTEQGADGLCICSHPKPQHDGSIMAACSLEWCACIRFRPAPIARNLWGVEQAVILPERNELDCD